MNRRRDLAYTLKTLRTRLHDKYDAADKRKMDDIVDALLSDAQLPPEGWMITEVGPDRVVFAKEVRRARQP